MLHYTCIPSNFTYKYSAFTPPKSSDNFRNVLLYSQLLYGGDINMSFPLFKCGWTLKYLFKLYKFIYSNYLRLNPMFYSGHGCLLSAVFTTASLNHWKFAWLWLYELIFKLPFHPNDPSKYHIPYFLPLRDTINIAHGVLVLVTSITSWHLTLEVVLFNIKLVRPNVTSWVRPWRQYWEKLI